MLSKKNICKNILIFKITFAEQEHTGVGFLHAAFAFNTLVMPANAFSIHSFLQREIKILKIFT